MTSWYTKVFFVTLLVSLATFVVTKISPPIPISSVITQKDSLFTVSGEAKVTVVPDIAIVQLGITSTGTTVKAVQAQANQVINTIVDKIKSLGIAEKDIETSNYSIYPQYDYQTSGNRITGYNITANLSVTVRKLDTVNDVIDSATSLGANTVGGIQFTVNDTRRKELVKEARSKAVTEAKTKAADLASAGGLTLGRLINIQESSPSIIRPMYESAKAVGLGGADTSTQVQPGSTDITSSVTLSYETR